MKSNEPAGPEKRQPLDDFLRTWKVEGTLPKQTTRNVWRRVYDVEAAQLPAAAMIYGLVSKALLALSRPKWACACLLLFLSLGLGSGWLSARRETERVKHALSERYVSMIAPENLQH